MQQEAKLGHRIVKRRVGRREGPGLTLGQAESDGERMEIDHLADPGASGRQQIPSNKCQIVGFGGRPVAHPDFDGT